MWIFFFFYFNSIPIHPGRKIGRDFKKKKENCKRVTEQCQNFNTFRNKISEISLIYSANNLKNYYVLKVLNEWLMIIQYEFKYVAT